MTIASLTARICRQNDSTITVLKWLGILLMTGDHANKYLLHDSIPTLFDLGRLTMPLFAFVLGFNLARPSMDHLARRRMIRRLLSYGALATIPFVALGGLGWGWWPLNILFSLATATCIVDVIERQPRFWRSQAALLFVLGGLLIEFWWPGLAVVLCSWMLCRRPTPIRATLWIMSIASLGFINGNQWALTTIALLMVLPSVTISVPRARAAFYWYYPLHLCALLAIGGHAG